AVSRQSSTTARLGTQFRPSALDRAIHTQTAAPISPPVYTCMRAHQALRCGSVSTVVEAAAIGVTGTVIVGVAGFGASIWNTRKTLAAAHKSWIREQRAIAYVEAIAAVHYRQFSRQVAAGFGPLTEAVGREALAAYRRPDWNVLEAR